MNITSQVSPIMS